MPRSGSMLEAEFEGEWAAARERVLQLWATERESSTRGVEASRAVVIERSGLPKAWVERMLKSEVPPNRPGRPEALNAGLAAEEGSQAEGGTRHNTKGQDDGEQRLVAHFSFRANMSAH